MRRSLTAIKFGVIRRWTFSEGARLNLRRGATTIGIATVSGTMTITTAAITIGMAFITTIIMIMTITTATTAAAMTAATVMAAIDASRMR